MEKRTYDALSETMYWDTLPNGLTIAVLPRPGFTRKIAYFVADFGSIHSQFTADGVPVQAPGGVAHYLEHKMFDMPGRDINAEFAALGASPNAFTSYDMTAYYFTCTENFPQCLSLLLDFVSTPYFTPESVEKEQGIIGQEIDMNEDNPDTKIFELLMQAMYENHPVREAILGTRDTIAQITPQVLSQCHQAFYAPSNMMLCIVGDVDPRQVRQIALAQLPAQGLPRVQVRRSWSEDMTCREHFVSTAMEVAMPTFQLAFKSEPLPMGMEAVLEEVVGDLAAEALFGESSPLYLQLYEDGIIDTSFGGGFESVEGMAILTASGDSDDPEAIRDAILQQAQILLRDGIPEQDFLRMKRSALGRRIRGLDGFDSTCFRICAYHFSGYDYFRFPELYEKVEVSHVLQFIQRVVTPQRCCLCIIYPNEQEESQ